jgi:TPR repeat protein
MKRAAVNDAASICALASHYEYGGKGLQQDQVKAMEIYVRAADLGNNKAHFNLANFYRKGGDLKKAKFHYEAAAMLGNELARYNLACSENDSGHLEQSVKHCIIAASAGYHKAMNNLLVDFEQGLVSRESINSTLAAYNNSCAEMRSEARDDYIRFKLETM